MSWSLPPEEAAAFVIPGHVRASPARRRGENPTNISAYYWGRMSFTQTASYMGLLPWLLLPLPLIFRRETATPGWRSRAWWWESCSPWGNTPRFYNFLFDHFPGINRFRVPKMIMFIPVLGLGVLSGLGSRPAA